MSLKDIRGVFSRVKRLKLKLAEWRKISATREKERELTRRKKEEKEIQGESQASSSTAASEKVTPQSE